MNQFQIMVWLANLIKKSQEDGIYCDCCTTTCEVKNGCLIITNTDQTKQPQDVKCFQIDIKECNGLVVPTMPVIPETKKMTWQQLKEYILDFNKKHNVRYAGPDNQPRIVARVVFDPFKSEWTKVNQYNGKEMSYSPAGCTYQFDNLGKYWDSETIGRSLYANSLDPNESDSFGVNLTDYLGDWHISYCYIVSENGEMKI